MTVPSLRDVRKPPPGRGRWNLTEASFYGPNRTATNFVGANLTNANLNDAVLLNADLYEATATGVLYPASAIWTDAQCPNGLLYESSGANCP